VFEERDGWRYTCFATDTRVGQLAFLDARHRAHARVEDRIRCGKDTGLNHFPSRSFHVNAAWLTVVMLAVDLLSWTHARSAANLGPDSAVLALGDRPGRGVLQARCVACSCWLIVEPDTMSGVSYRQNEHAGHLPCLPVETGRTQLGQLRSDDQPAAP
jgi:hypothetical protein